MFHREVCPFGRVVHVGGELDMTSCGNLEKAVVDAAADIDADACVYVSFESCSYLDSSTISALVRLRRTLGDRLCIVADGESRARRLLSLCGLLEYLHVIPRVPRLRDAAIPARSR